MDHELEVLLQQIREAGRPPFWQSTPAQARSAPTLMKFLFGGAPSVTRVEDLTIESTDGYQLPVRLYVPSSAPRGLIVYLHGGGWVVGSVEDYHPLTAMLANRTGCAVLSVDYRRAPEHPFPVPVEDARTAIKWAADHSEQVIGANIPFLIAMGDSAGANLATVAARSHNAARLDRLVDVQVLAYPVTDHDFDTESYLDFAEGNLLTRKDMQWFWYHYCPDVAMRASPDASPLGAADLSALPPALIMTAARDPLRDEGEAYGRRLMDAGVDVSVVRCEGLVHGFLAMVQTIPSAGRAFETIVRYIRESCGSP